MSQSRTIEIQKIGTQDICKIGNIDDGDTFDLHCTKWYYSDVRLIWVNTPDYDHRIEWGKCYYDQARSYIEKRKQRSYEVTFYGNDLCKDQFKWCRNLVQLVDTETHVDMGQMMIMRWIAFSWTNFSVVPLDMSIKYDHMQNIASQYNRWLWSQCNITTDLTKRLNSSIPQYMTTINIARVSI